MGLSERISRVIDNLLNGFNTDSNTANVSNIDNSNRESHNTVFGESIIGQKIPSVAAQFMYGFDTRNATVTETGTGTISVSDSMLVGQTGASASSKALVQSKSTIRYIPGHECYMFFTALYDTPKAGSTQKAGLYDGDDGFWLGYDGVDFGFMRLRDGVEYWVSISDWYTDVITGDNTLNFILDPQKGNVYKISYGFLGFANITLEVLCPCGKWIKLHTIEYPNSNTETNVANTYLPVRAEVENTTNDTNITMKSGSISAGIIDGGTVEEDVTARRFSARVGPTATGTNTPIAIFRNKTSFNSKTNHVKARVLRISLSSDGAQQVAITFVKDIAITNTPTWTDVDADNSVIDYSVDATITAGTGSEEITIELSKVTDYVENVTYYQIELLPGETMTILCNGNNSVLAGFNWKEMF